VVEKGVIGACQETKHKKPKRILSFSSPGIHGDVTVHPIRLRTNKVKRWKQVCVLKILQASWSEGAEEGVGKKEYYWSSLRENEGGDRTDSQDDAVL